MDEEPKAPPEESEDSPEDPEYEAETPLDGEPEEPEAPPEEWEDDTEAPLDGDESAIGLIYTRKRSCRTEGYREEVGRQRNAWKKRKWKWKKR